MEIKNQKQTLAVENADLSGSAFRDVNMAGAMFEDDNLSRASFNDINLSGASFRNIDFTGVEATDCNLAGMKIDGIPVQVALDAYRRSLAVATPDPGSTSLDSTAEIRPYCNADESAVIELWKSVFGCTAPHNDPALAIRQKLAVAPELFLVAIRGGELAGTIMGGYDGHRGWIYLLAVHPEHRRHGVATALVGFVERGLVGRGCVKVNLQVLGSNIDVVSFYEKLGYQVEERISMGKVLT
jgi:ribosomal protein S18 acetylase RimI-like enzyme